MRCDVSIIYAYISIATIVLSTVPLYSNQKLAYAGIVEEEEGKYVNQEGCGSKGVVGEATTAEMEAASSAECGGGTTGGNIPSKGTLTKHQQNELNEWHTAKRCRQKNNKGGNSKGMGANLGSMGC